MKKLIPGMILLLIILFTGMGLYLRMPFSIAPHLVEHTDNAENSIITSGTGPGKADKNSTSIDPASMMRVKSEENRKGRCVSGDCINGTGTFLWENGNTYAGQWKDGKRHGFGKMTWLISTVYASGKLAEKKTYNKQEMESDGAGIEASLTSSTWLYNSAIEEAAEKFTVSVMDNQYSGKWYKDMMHGRGILLLKPGFIVTGTWRYNEFVGK